MEGFLVMVNGSLWLFDNILFISFHDAVTFSSFLLSPSGDKLLYIAEKVEAKAKSYFGIQDGKNNQHICSIGA